MHSRNHAASIQAKLAGSLLLSSLLMGLGATAPVYAQQTTSTPIAANAEVAFDIPALPLSSALTLFGQQAGLQISVEPNAVQGLGAQAVSGSLTPNTALDLLLSGTGLTYRFSGADTVVVQSSSGAEGSLLLDMIDVTGIAAGNPANAPYETAGSSSYISSETIQQFRGSSPSDLFRGTPGVLSGESRNSGGVDVNIRGLQGYGRVAVTIDGAQQASVTDRGYRGDANRTMIDPDLLSSVSITRGPSNDPSASGAIAGHVAMTTITADDILRPGENSGVRLIGGFSTNSVSPPEVGTWRGLGVGTTTYVTESDLPSDTVEGVPSSLGEPARGRTSFLRPTGFNGSVALAGRWDNFEWVAALSHRERGNYFAGTRGDYARIELRDVLTDSGTVSQLQKNSWDTNYPGHGFEVGDPWTRTRHIYSNAGSTVYRPGEEVVNTSNMMTSALLKGVWTLNGGHRFELGYLRNETEYGFAWPTFVTLGTGVGLNLIAQNELAQAQADMVTGRYWYDPNDNDLVDTMLNGWFTRQTVHEVATTDMTNVNGYESRDDYVEGLMVGFDLSNRSQLSSAWGDVSLRYGLAYITQDVNTYTDSKRIRDGDIISRSIGETSVAREQWDVFVNGSWEPTYWLQLDAGLRYMTARSEQWAVVEGVDGSLPTAEDTVRSSSGFAPNIGFTVEPITGLQIYGTYSQGWRAPTFTELSTYYAHTEARDYPGLVNGSHLREERATNYEIGANLLRHDVLQAGDTLGLTVGYFINEIDDYISNVLNLIPWSGGVATGSTTTNFNHARYSGIEISTRYDSDRFFGEAAAIYYDRIKICPTAEFCYVSGSDDGIRVNGWRHHTPPKYSLSLTAGMRLLDQRFTLAGRLTHTGRSAGEGAILDPSLIYVFSTNLWDSHTLVDAFGSYQINETMTVDFAVENLFDIYYKEPLTHISQPGPGRTFRFNMTFRL